jgi:hypothetical protein
LYFSKSATQKEIITYQKTELIHVTLPDEMLEFCFYRFPDLYAHFLVYNKEIILLDQEIERINNVGSQYPDQKMIADKEAKTWVKDKNNP